MHRVALVLLLASNLLACEKAGPGSACTLTPDPRCAGLTFDAGPCPTLDSCPTDFGCIDGGCAMVCPWYTPHSEYCPSSCTCIGSHCGSVPGSECSGGHCIGSGCSY
jgi:hypothetical protein